MVLKTSTLLFLLALASVIIAFFRPFIGIIGILVDCTVIVCLLISLCRRHLGKIRFFLKDVFARPILVNALIMMRFGAVKHFNLGDDLNWFLVKRLLNNSVSLLNESVLGLFFKKDNYLIIGSTITFMTNENTIVWGAGVIDGNKPLKAKPKKVCAVRGPLSRKYLLEKGVDCPEIYGDPALLMKYFYKPQTGKKYKLGVIPHYVDFDSEKFEALREDPNVLFIKMQDYKSVQEVVNQIASCEMILSSSLHGLILSETYGVPNLWMKVSDNIVGENFKYLDYYESIGIHDAVPYLFNGNETEDELIDLFGNYKKGCIDLRPLIKAAPFKLNIEA